jgi:hypothetical protein
MAVLFTVISMEVSFLTARLLIPVYTDKNTSHNLLYEYFPIHVVANYPSQLFQKSVIDHPEI